MYGVRTPRNVLSVGLLMAACMAQLIPGATAQTSPPERGTNATNATSPLKKAGSPDDQYTTGIVTGDPNGTEFAAASEIATVVATGQETGPHGEVALRVAPMVGAGGLQNIRDVLTLAEADLSIVPVALLNRAPALGLGDIRKSIVYIAPLYVEEFHLVVPVTTQNISDLAGKTVNLGMKNSAGAILGGEIFERLGVKVNMVNLDQSGAMSAMRTGDIAAVLVLSGKPADSLASYSILKDGFHLIAIPFLPALGKDFLPVTLTNDDYPKLTDYKVNTIGARSVLIAYNWPKGSGRYRLLDSFVRTLFSRFAELKAGPHYPKWEEVNLAATVPGWRRFPTAQRWLDQQEFESFLSKFGTGAAADRARLFDDFLRWRKQSGGG
jgi:TRAP-type uncharacterized transport system substrate-binding protein